MDWLTENFWLAWLGIALVLAAVEAATVDFVFIMFAGGALAGAVAAQMGLPIERLIVATNVNDILHRALAKGDYSVGTVTP